MFNHFILIHAITVNLFQIDEVEEIILFNYDY